MSLVSSLNSLITRIGTEIKSMKSAYSGNNSGSIAGLSTTDKTSLLGAINEVYGMTMGKQPMIGYEPENVSRKGTPNGYAGLDSGGRVPIGQLPDVLNRNKGYFATVIALTTAYPTATNGDFAVVGATDTIWAWDGDASAWVETDRKGQVTSVNGLTGEVVLPDATTSVSGMMSGADKTKLNGIAAGATVNDSDANLKNRANHTGTQAASTISDFASAVRSSVLTGMSLATYTVITTTDSVLTAFGKLQAQINIHFGSGGNSHATANTTQNGFMSSTDKTKLDGIASGATSNSTDTYLRDRANHTGSQLASTISDLTGAVLSTLLTGITTATNSAVTATDSIISALGKIQSQINAHFGAGGTAHASVVASGASGFMTGTDKAKLDGIATGANNYSHPTGDGNIHVPATGTTSNTKVLKAGSTAGAVSWGFVDFSEITNKPATLALHGITDAYTKTEIGDVNTDFVTAFNTAIAS